MILTAQMPKGHTGPPPSEVDVDGVMYDVTRYKCPRGSGLVNVGTGGALDLRKTYILTLRKRKTTKAKESEASHADPT